MITNIKLKATIKFWASEVMYVELRAQKVWNLYSLPLLRIILCEMLTLMCIEHTSTMLPVKIMIINIKLKVTTKFGASEMICVELRAQKESPKATKCP